MEKNKKTQMSESLITMAFLTLSGGLQDAYSYFVRGKVFANAQTGNIVLMANYFFKKDWIQFLKYLLPVLSFALGIFIAEQIEYKYKSSKKIHWRQIVILFEIIFLTVVGFMPHNLDMLANIIVSFSCAMQVQAFRKIKGYPFASTMCIGNLKTGVATLSKYTHTKEKEDLKKSMHYFYIICIFALGAGLGSILVSTLEIRLILVSSAILLCSYILMLRKEKNEV